MSTKSQMHPGGIVKLISIAMIGAAMLGTPAAYAAVQGITGVAGSPTFALSANEGTNSQPDGAQIYVWGYGCSPTQTLQKFSGTGPQPSCPTMQMPGPTMIVTEGDIVTVTLTNSLPAAAGATSIVFPGFQVCTATLNADGTCTGTPTGSAGLLTQEAANGGTVTYTFKATNPGTYAYYSGTQPDLQIEMGLFGAIVVKPSTPPTNCRGLGTTLTGVVGEFDSRLAPAAYDHPDSCYDREYLFQFSEMKSLVHEQVQAQVQNCPTAPCPQITATMEPPVPNYFLINGRSMPDLMDSSYSPAYSSQPYNANPQMHPGERLLMRVIGQGRLQHPFHFHGNHARVLARDGSMLLAKATNTRPGLTPLAGPLLFTIPTVSGQSVDAIFTWTGQGLNWDVYGAQTHTCNGIDLPTAQLAQSAPAANATTITALNANGGYDPKTKEYCPDHGKAMPVTPPDPQIVANGQWYGGTPFLGLSNFNSVNLPPGTLNQNPGAGYAYMWHSHNEREITTNDVFPGGMMMMLIINPPQWVIDETQ